MRNVWVEARDDTEQLDSLSSEYSQQRMADAGLDHLRFQELPKPRRAKAGKNVSQMHYAKQGIITPEMEFIAIRENTKRVAMGDAILHEQHPGQGRH